MLRELYNSGFRSWLAGNISKPVFFKRHRDHAVTASKLGAQKAINQDQLHYKQPFSLIEEFGLDSDDCNYEILFKKLASLSMSTERDRQHYRPNEEGQKARANQIEVFKQELFASFFNEYINEEFKWVLELTDDDYNSEVKPLSEDQNSTSSDSPAEDKIINDWQALFYGWLYLLPPEEVSKLRHQMKKSLVLEGKGSQATSGLEPQSAFMKALNEIDSLMGLYTKIQAAGFDGTEHKKDLNLVKTFYQDIEQAEKLYQEPTHTVDGQAIKIDNALSIPGTRRGLRQILRYNHIPFLEGIIKKHRVTFEEVDEFSQCLTDVNKSDSIKQAIKKRKDIRDEIEKSFSSKKRNDDDLKKLASEYQKAVTTTALYDFNANAVRLPEHYRLHQLMMRVVGRLTDFTLLWERDRAYSFLGMLYDSVSDNDMKFVGHQAFTLEELNKQKKPGIPRRLGLKFENTILKKMQAQADKLTVSDTDEDNLLLKRDLQAGFIPLWREGKGFDLKSFRNLKFLLSEPNRAHFEHYFEGIDKPNPKDVDEKKRKEEEGNKIVSKEAGQGLTKSKGCEKVRGNYPYKQGRQQIRNDFAHYNVINRMKGPPKSFTYLVNAVRSLMAYDRKLKNAVTKAIKDILLDEGLVIKWQMDQDRLVRPEVTPDVETHLTMIFGELGRDLQFDVPRASVRSASMVKALFDFEKGGNRAKVNSYNQKSDKIEKKNKGGMTYPKAFIQKYSKGLNTDKMKSSMPHDLLTFAYPNYVNQPQNKGK